MQVQFTSIHISVEGNLVRETVYVNPSYVTTVAPSHVNDRFPTHCKLWVVADAGYGTRSLTLEGSADDIATALNNSERMTRGY